jgi:hypothetical protein
MDKELEAPCAGCVGYSNFVKGSVYATNHSSQPLKEAIDDWFNKDSPYMTEEEFWIEDPYDVVDKPKHYMLFEEEGIEVRDVLKKLSNKLKHFSPMFIADYVQMMQYGMRFMDKNGLEDLKKQRWYLDKMIEDYEHHV